MNFLTRRSFINSFLLISFIILIASVFLSYYRIQRLLEANQWVVHTYKVIESANDIVISTATSTMLIRNYLDTNNAEVLKNYNTYIDKLKNEIIQLQRLTADNPAQQKNVSAFLPYVQQQIDVLQNTLKATTPAQKATSLAQLALSHEMLLPSISLGANKINQNELLLLKSRNMQLRYNAQTTELAIILVGALGGTFILLSFFFLNFHLSMLHRAQAEKETSEIRLKKIIDGSNDLIAAVDNDMKVMAYNTAFAQKIYDTFGISINNDMAFSEALNSVPMSETLIANWQRALKGEEFTTEVQLMDSDKSPQLYEATYTLIRDSENPKQFIGASQIMRNITERKKVENLKNEFISVVSHELRTPLTSIRGSLGILLNDPEKKFDAKTKGMLTIASNNCERLVTLINDILDIQKIETEHVPFVTEPVELNLLASEVVQQCQELANHANIKLNISKSESPLLVNADLARLRQVISNFVTNAIKFSLKGSTVDIVVSSNARQGKVAVTDYGPGIAKSFQKEVFKKFSQADTSSVRKQGGSGLGLSISKAIIERLGGNIDFISEEGKGATFYFELPLVQSVYVPKKIISPVHNRDHSQKKILYVEDNLDLAEVIKAVLATEAEVFTASTKHEALELLNKQKFDLILLDIVLPDGSGAELLPELKLRDTPVVVFTAHELPEIYTAYTSNILIKSRTTNEKLIETIRSVLDTTTTI